MFWKVIEEIEEMMQESPDPEDDETPTQSDRLSMLSQEIQTLKRSSMSSYEERKRPSLHQPLCLLSASNTVSPFPGSFDFPGSSGHIVLCTYLGHFSVFCCIFFKLCISLL